MIVRYTVVAMVLLLAVPVFAVENAQPIADELNFDEPFDQAAVKSALRALFNQAIEAIEDHIEFNVKTERNQETHEERGRLQLKVYPKGKSHPDDHFSGELRFRSSPDDQDFHLDLKLPKTPYNQSLPSSEHSL